MSYSGNLVVENRNAHRECDVWKPTTPSVIRRCDAGTDVGTKRVT